MPTVFCDIESEADRDINLRDVGAHVYAAHPSTNPLLLRHAIDDGPVETWWPGDPVPAPFANPAGYDFVFDNWTFERQMLERILIPRYGFAPIPLEQIDCAQRRALASALPAELGKRCTALGLPYEKDPKAAAAMRRLARKHAYKSPEARQRDLTLVWERCGRDVEMTRACSNHPRVRALPPNERLQMLLDAEIMDRGVSANLTFLNAMRALTIKVRSDANTRLAELTGDTITSVFQRDKILAAVNAHGHAMEKLGKRAVAAVLAGNPDDFTREVLELRRAGSAADPSERLLAHTSPDGRIRGWGRYHGAGPGRWTSPGAQLHNLARNDGEFPATLIDAVLSGDTTTLARWGDPLKVASQIARAALCAAPEHELICADLAAIESRVLAWLAGEGWKLDVFRQFDATKNLRFDLYRVIAARLLRKDVDGISKAERQTPGKGAELSCGFGGSVGAWRRIIGDRDPRSDAEIMQDVVAWRDAHPATTRFWFRLAKAARLAIQHSGHEIRVNPAPLPSITTYFDGTDLTLTLPSGRAINYPNARLIPNAKFADGDADIEFMDNARGAWKPMRAWYGILVENVVQGVARDLLAAAILRAEARWPGLVVFHCHDELVLEAPIGTILPQDVLALFTEPPDWAAGLPLGGKVRNGPLYFEGPATAEPPNESIVTDDESVEDDQDHHPVEADHVDLPPAHVCTVCGEAPDGTEREIFDEIWLHPRCEAVYIDEGLRGAGISPMARSAWSSASTAPSASAASTSTGPTSGNGGGNGRADNFDDFVSTTSPIGAPSGAPTAKATATSASTPTAKKQFGGSKAEIAHDTYAEDHADEPFSDAHLRAQGYRFTNAFVYALADGTPLYCHNRYELPAGVAPTKKRPRKRFLTHREVNGKRVFGATARRVIFNWSAIMRAGPGNTVFIPEGENKVIRLAKAGLLATTVLSHKWTVDCAAALTGQHVIILADHDGAGEKTAANTRKALERVAASIRVVPAAHLWRHLPNGAREIAEGDDVIDWADLGGDLGKLGDICREIPAEGVITAKPFVFQAEADLPRWEWLYGRHLLRGEVSGTNATGGTGKSSLSIAEAVAMASGKPLLDLAVPALLRVVLINLEDTRTTMAKRIAAVMRHYGLTVNDLGDRLIVIGKGEVQIKVARQLRSGDVEHNTQAIRGLIELVRKHRADVLSIDSLIRTHRVNENDNSAMQEVIECYEIVATEAQCSVHLWHHNRKGGGEQATVASARGASAIGDAYRSARVLETMTGKEHAQLLEFQPDMAPPGFYFRAFNGKRSFAPPAETSDWFKLENLTLANGDDVGVVTTWAYPASLVTLTPEEADAVIAEIDRGLPDGRRFSNNNRTVGERRAWPIVEKHCPGKTEEQYRRVINGWVKQAVLYEEEYYDPTERKKRKGLFARTPKKTENGE